MKFTAADLKSANARLKMLNFYPSDPEAQAAIMELLAKMCPHKEALVWLVDAMVNGVGTWKGPAELRGVLCWRYRPADGIEHACTITGFTAEDGERISLERHAEIQSSGTGASTSACEELAGRDYAEETYSRSQGRGMSQGCYQTWKVAGKCSSCGHVSDVMHIPPDLRTLHCPECCPVCNPPRPRAAAAMTAGPEAD